MESLIFFAIFVREREKDFETFKFNIRQDFHTYIEVLSDFLCSVLSMSLDFFTSFENKY